MMNKNKSQLIAKLLTGLFLIFLTTNGFSRIYHNGSGKGYEPPDGGEKTSTNVNIIEIYVEKGAGYLLNGYSDFITFLSRVELQDQNGVDFDELRQLIDSALNHVKNAKYTYHHLVGIAEVTPYNQVVISLLKSFDYDAFIEEKSLNRIIFEKEVEKYLAKGDITGIYKRTYEKLNTFDMILTSFKIEIDSNGIPGLPALWDLNESWMEALTAGQYTAGVFYEMR
jgi:hypothetical protein